MTWVRQAWAVAVKDLRLEVRGREAVNSVVPFAGTLLVVFGLAFGPGRTALRAAAPSLLWLAILFSGILVLRGALETESEDGALEGLVLAPADRSAIYLGKVFAVATQLLALEAITLLGSAFLFDLPAGNLAVVAVAFVSGTVGFAAVGTLFAVLTAKTRAREALFPLLVMPVVVPVLLAGIRATELAMSGGADAGSWLGLLAAFAILAVSVGALIFEHLVEE